MATRNIYDRGFDEDVPNGDTDVCPECEGTVRTNTAETACDDCGLVLSEYEIDHGPEWRIFSADDESKRRVGSPLTPARHDRGLSTEIGYKRDAGGRKLPNSKRVRVARMRREHSRGRFRSTAEQNLATGFTEIRRISGMLDLPTSIRDQACTLFRSAQNENLLRGRSIESIAAASVYGVCRCNGFSRSIEEVSRPSRVSQARVTKAYKTLNTELKLPTQPITPKEYIPRLASELCVPNRVQHRAQKLALAAESTGTSIGLNPAGFAGACLYKASRETDSRLRQTDVAEAANVSPATIRSNWKSLDELPT